MILTLILHISRIQDTRDATLVHLEKARDIFDVVCLGLITFLGVVNSISKANNDYNEIGDVPLLHFLGRESYYRR